MNFDSNCFSNSAGTHQIEQSPLTDSRIKQLDEIPFKGPCTAPFSLHNSSHRPATWLYHQECSNGSNPSLQSSAVTVRRCAPDLQHCYGPSTQPSRAEAPKNVARAARHQPSSPRHVNSHHVAVRPYAAALCALETAAAECPLRPHDKYEAPPPIAEAAAAERGLDHDCAAAGSAAAAGSSSAFVAAVPGELEPSGAEEAWDPALLAWADCAWDVRSLLDDGPP